VVVRAAYAFLRSVLRLDAKPSVKPKGRTVKQYRAQKLEQKKRDGPAVVSAVSSRHLSPGALSPGTISLSESSGGRRGRRQRTLLAQTIAEEEDSDF